MIPHLIFTSGRLSGKRELRVTFIVDRDTKDYLRFEPKQSFLIQWNPDNSHCQGTDDLVNISGALIIVSAK